MNRSSRAKPASTLLDRARPPPGCCCRRRAPRSADRIAGSVSASPTCIMLIVRGGGRRSGRCSAAASISGERAGTSRQQAAAAWRQAPTSAGRQAIARNAMPPPRALHAVVEADRRPAASSRSRARATHLDPASMPETRGALGRLLAAARSRSSASRRCVARCSRGRAGRARRSRASCRARARRRCRAGAGCARGAPRPFGAARDRCRRASRRRLGLLDERPEVQVRGDRVAAPDDDQPALGEVLRACRPWPPNVAATPAAGRRADRAVEQRRAEAVEEARRHALALHHPHRAG